MRNEDETVNKSVILQESQFVPLETNLPMSSAGVAQGQSGNQSVSSERNQPNGFGIHSAISYPAPSEPNSAIKDNVPFFLKLALVYGICFAIAFFKNFIGITYPLITAVTLGACGLFLKKYGVVWKKSNWWYISSALLLGISTILTTNAFIIFFNTVGIILLISVFMVRQAYDGREWNSGQYICNLLFLYLCMIPEVASPFIHLADYLKKNRKTEQKNKNARYVWIGILIGLPMLFIVVGLLSSADQIFSKLVGSFFLNLWDQVIFSPNVFLVFFLVVLGFFGIYSFFSALTLNNLPEWKRKKQKRNPLIAITFLSMITAVYLIFCTIQLIFLFTGGKLLPKEYTYAEYAHQGFFQLLFVCLFNLLLVALCLAVFKQNRLLKVLLLVFSGCTYIMIASSAFRMALYIEAYHLSFLRVLVLWFLAMLVFLMAGVIVNIVKGKFRLFRYSMAVATVFYLLFSFGRPDALVASYNLAMQGDSISYGDIAYLASLSMDAAPALSKCKFGHSHSKEVKDYYSSQGYIEDEFGNFYNGKNGRFYMEGCKRCRLDRRFQEILDETGHMGIRTFHISKYMARVAAENYFESRK